MVARSYYFIVILGFRLIKRNSMPRMLKKRLDDGARLYKAGIAPVIIVQGGRTNMELGYTEAEAMKRYLVKMGIPPKSILKESRSLTTVENAFFLKRMLDGKGKKRLIVVTSKSHSKRAEYIFGKVIGKAQSFYFHAAPVPKSSVKSSEEYERRAWKVLGRQIRELRKKR
ncbi:MAG: YdcF family protein [Candidatus Micrarchaeota archaeon]|nr:YdcF family protein [Candidatus Micrarchaeota archaeon]